MKYTFGGIKKRKDENGKAIPFDWASTWTGWLVAAMMIIKVIARDFNHEQTLPFLGMAGVVLLILLFMFFKKIIQRREWDWSYPVSALILAYVTRDEISYACSTYM